jgi:hypothetical protein
LKTCRECFRQAFKLAATLKALKERGQDLSPFF